jgi:hypothetical protein
LFLEVVVLVVWLESLQEVRLLGILPLEFTTGMGGVVALRRIRETVHGLSFVVLVLLQAERVGSLRVVTVVVFVEVALVGEMVWFVLTPLSSKWLGTGFTLLVLTPVLSCLFAHVLVFEFQVGDLKNIWLIDFGCSRHMTGDRGWFSSLVPVVTSVDAKCAPSAKHRASRTSWLHTCKESQDVPVNFPENLTKDNVVKYQSLELAG